MNVLKQSRCKKVTHRSFESLEARRLLATVVWDGGPTGNGTSFTDPVNWVGDVLPGAADTAEIGATGSSPTINIASGISVPTITSTRNISLSSVTLTGTSISFSGGAALLGTSSTSTLNNVAVSGDLVLSSTSATLRITGNTSFAAARMQANATQLQFAPGYVLNAQVIAEGATGGTRAVSVANGGAGSFTISPTGSITLAATSGGDLTISDSSTGTLVNQGTIQNLSSTRTLTANSTTVNNSGTLSTTGGNFNITSSTTTLTNSGSFSAVNATLSIAPVNWSSTGSITVNNSTLNLGGSVTTAGLDLSSFTRTGGTVNLTGNLNNANDTLTLNAATGTWNLLGGTITGGSLQFAGGSTLGLTSSTGNLIDVAVTGDLVLNTTSATVRVGGSTTFGTARLQSNATQLQFAPGYTLSNAIVVEGAATGTRTVRIAQGGTGNFTISPTGSITLAAGSGGDLSFNDSSTGELINQGTIQNLSTNRLLTISPTNFTNTSTVSATGGTINISSSSFTNSGNLTASNATLGITATNWSTTGSVTVNNATFNVGGTVTTAGLDLPSFTRTGGTVNLTGNLVNTGNTLTLNATTGSWILAGGTITGGSLQVAGGNILVYSSSGGNLTDVAVAGDLVLDSTSATVRISGTTTFTAARLQANATQIQFAPGYVLNVPIIAEGANTGTRTIRIAVGASGNFTVSPTGSITLAAGAAGDLSLSDSSTGTFINQGTIQNLSTNRILTLSSTTFTNSSSINATGGSVNITPTNFTNSGTVSGNNATLTVNPTTLTNNGTLSSSGGTLSIGGNWSNTGSIIVNNATLNLGGTFSNFNTAGFSRTGGTVNLSGSYNNTAATLTLNATTGSWNLLGGTITGGSLQFVGGNSLLYSSSGGTLADVAVNGDITLNTTSSFVRLSGTTTFTAVRLQANATQIQFAPGFVLSAPVISEGANTGTRNVRVAVGGNGNFTISPTGSITLDANSAGDLSISDSNTGTLINQGTIQNLSTNRTLTINPTTFTNNSTLNTTGGSININATNFTNSGTVSGNNATLSVSPTTLTNNGTFSVSNGTLTIGGTWTSPGSIVVSNTTLNLGGNFSNFNSAGLTRTGGTINFTGNYNNTAATFTLNNITGSWNLLGGTITGGSLQFVGGNALLYTSNGGTLSDVAVSGDIVLTTTSSLVRIAGNTTFAAVRLQGNATQIQFAPGYTLNAPVIAEGATPGTRNVRIAVGGNGNFTISPTGSITLATDSGANLSISDSNTGTLINNGTIANQSANRTLTINPTTFTNNATLENGTGIFSVSTTSSLSLNNGTISTDGNFVFTNAATLSSAVTWEGNGTLAFIGGLTLSPGWSVVSDRLDFVFNYTTNSPIQTLIDAQNNGIITSDTDDGAGNPTLLVLFDNSGVQFNVFNGITVDTTAVIGRFTYTGDANLDGQVDAFDYSIVDDNFGSPGTFISGDLNQDGFVDAFDYSSIDDTFGAGVNNPLRPAGIENAVTALGRTSATQDVFSRTRISDGLISDRFFSGTEAEDQEPSWLLIRGVLAGRWRDGQL